MRVLLVEDDSLIGAAIHQSMSLDGYAVDWAESVADAEVALETTSFDVVLLDLGLPDGSGLDLLRCERRSGNDATVIILTARDSVADRVAGLDCGADDYLVKPFKLDELYARLRAVQRRRYGRSEPLVIQGPLELNPAGHICRWHGEEVSLSVKEFALLILLAEQPGKVFSRHQLEDSLYSWEREVESNAVEVHIHKLRRKLSSDVIRTVRGVGYVLGQLT